MRLYDNDAYREQFMDTVYDLLSSDPDNNRANQIIAAFDCVPVIEAVPVEIPFEELVEMNKRAVYVVCWSDPEQSGWALLQIETILDELVIELRFLEREQSICLTRKNYHCPWVPCYREPKRAQACVFVSGERYRLLKADYDALKKELDAVKQDAQRTALSN